MAAIDAGMHILEVADATNQPWKIHGTDSQVRHPSVMK
jgi:hypothetical protein